MPVTRDLFVRNVDKLVDLGAKQIYVPISSPGGLLTAAQDIVDYMGRLQTQRGVAFTTHNIGVVASAACYVFLEGQRRLCAPNAAFLFHEATLVASGPLTSSTLQEQSVAIQQAEKTMLQMLTARTRLSSAEASSFIRRTVILNADEARRDGITQATEGLVVPRGETVYRIATRPNPAAPSALPPKPPDQGR